MIEKTKGCDRWPFASSSVRPIPVRAFRRRRDSSSRSSGTSVSMASNSSASSRSPSCRTSRSLITDIDLLLPTAATILAYRDKRHNCFLVGNPHRRGKGLLKRLAGELGPDPDSGEGGEPRY